MKLGPSLPLQRCPHCHVAKPGLKYVNSVETENDRSSNSRCWYCFKCTTCGGVIMAVAPVRPGGSHMQFDITSIWPSPQVVDEAVPARARAFLEQAIASSHAPAGAVMLTASAVDAMLKEKGLKEGSLNARIKSAAGQHLITAEMATWAHEIRLDANDQRHADDGAALPDEADAAKAIEFATALAQFLFVLPARVARGRAQPN